MFRGMLWVLALCCLFVGRLEAQTWAESINGNDLLKYCGERPSGARTFCLGYVTGVANALWGAKDFCISDREAKMDQLADIVETHLRDHPEERDEPAIELVKRALGAKFPCD